MDKFQELLGEELYKQVATKLGDVKVVIDNGTFIPKYRFDEKLEEIKHLKSVSEKYESDIKALKPLVTGNEVLAKQIADLEVSNKAKEVEFNTNQLKTKKSFAVKEALMNAGVSDAEARELLYHKFDIDKIELDDKGQPKGFDDVVKPIKDNPVFKPLFGVKKMAGQEHNTGEMDLSLGEYAKSNPFDKATRNISKQIELKRTNPDLAKKLEASAK